MEDHTMTITPEPQPTYWPPPPTPSPAPAPKRPRRLWLILGAIAVLLLVGLGIGIGVAAGGAATPAATSQPQSALDREQAANPILPDLTPTTEPAVESGASPVAANIKLTLKTTSKQCFGSAGCNLEVKVQMAYDGPQLSGDDTWLVTYELTGDESGPITNSFEVTGDQYTVNDEVLGTRSSKTKLHIKVTDVEKVGI